MSGSASESMSASGSESEEESSQHSKSESERASSESDAEAPVVASSAEELLEEDSEAGPSGVVGPAPPPVADAKSVEQPSDLEAQPTKTRNRNR